MANAKAEQRTDASPLIESALRTLDTEAGGIAALIAAIRGRLGAPLDMAIIEGAVEKLRAVLMAALLALFGLLPMALSQGIGSETQRPFALVIVGGMVTTLAITLFVLPGVYYMLAAERYSTPETEDEAA